MDRGTQLIKLCVLATSAPVIFAACSQAPKGEGQPGQASQSGFSIGGFQFKPAEVEPEPTQPTMKNLMGEPQKYPQRYPVVQYPNSRVMMAKVHRSLSSGQRHMVLLETTDNIERVAAYYKRQLQDEGWRFVSAFENTAYSSTIWEKGDREAEIRVCDAPNERERLIQLLIGRKKQ